MAIKRINLNVIENFLKEISEESEQISVLQQEVLNIDTNLKKNVSDLNSGRISREVNNDIKVNLEKEKMPLENRLKKVIENILINLEKLQEAIQENKI